MDYSCKGHAKGESNEEISRNVNTACHRAANECDGGGVEIYCPVYHQVRSSDKFSEAVLQGQADSMAKEF